MSGQGTGKSYRLEKSLTDWHEEFGAYGSRFSYRTTDPKMVEIPGTGGQTDVMMGDRLCLELEGER